MKVSDLVQTLNNLTMRVGMSCSVLDTIRIAEEDASQALLSALATAIFID